LDYLEIPVLYGSPILIRKILLRPKLCFLEGGLSFGRLTGEKLFFDEYNSFIENDEAPFKPFDLSLLGNFIIPTYSKFSYEIRFSQSLISIHKEYKIRNSFYGIGLNYRF
jgi:hypothetical protein